MKVIWGTDGSKGAEAVLPWLKGPLNQPDLEVVVTVAAPQPLLAAERPDPARLLWNLLPGYRERVSEEVVKLVEREVERLGRMRGGVESTVRMGSPASALVAVAAEERADLVAIGARGHGAVRDFLLGSVSRQVSLHAPCSVLVARSGKRPRRILVAWDGSVDQQAAEGIIAGFRGAESMEVLLLHAIEPVRAPERLPADWVRSGRLEELEAAQRDEASTGMRRAARQLRAAGWGTVRTRVARGRADEVILAEAEKFAPDLLVLGARGTSDRPMLTGGVADRVLLHAPSSVLLGRTSEVWAKD